MYEVAALRKGISICPNSDSRDPPESTDDTVVEVGVSQVVGRDNEVERVHDELGEQSLALPG